MSARAAGIPKPTLSNLHVPELSPLSVALPTMGIALWCIWATYTTTETLKKAAPTMMSPEVAADAAEPPEVVKSSQVTFIYIALLTIQIVSKHLTVSSWRIECQ